MTVNNQHIIIIFLLAYFSIGTRTFTTQSVSLNQSCQGACPVINGADVYPPQPEPGQCYPSYVDTLIVSCPPGNMLALTCSSNTPDFAVDDIQCIPDTFTTTAGMPPQNNCPPEPSPCSDPPPSTSDTVWIVIIVVLVILLILSWSGLLLICLRNRKGNLSTVTKKEAHNEYSPAPKVSKENKKKEKMSISARPPLPNPRPGNEEPVQEGGYSIPLQSQGEYAYIDSTQIDDADANAYLEVDG